MKSVDQYRMEVTVKHKIHNTEKLNSVTIIQQKPNMWITRY